MKAIEDSLTRNPYARSDAGGESERETESEREGESGM